MDDGSKPISALHELRRYLNDEFRRAGVSEVRFRMLIDMDDDKLYSHVKSCIQGCVNSLGRSISLNITRQGKNYKISIE